MNKQFISINRCTGWHCVLQHKSFSEHHFMLNLTDEAQLSHCIQSFLSLAQATNSTANTFAGTIKIFSSSSQIGITSLQDKYENILFTQVQQKPLNNCSIGIWATLFVGKICVEKSVSNCLFISTSQYKRIFWGGLTKVDTTNASEETTQLLESLSRTLALTNMSVAKHVHRTWFFIDDIGSDYDLFTDARKHWFINQGLTPETHYIASTGIEGGNSAGARIQMDVLAYDAANLKVEYLNDFDKLNPTIEYGVTFERGVSLQFEAVQYLYISGTASINNKGAVVHVGDPKKQTLRTLQNIESLLRVAGADLNNIVQAIVYVKNEGEYFQIKTALETYYPNFPCIYTVGAVCRPDWLVEIECTAVL